VSANPPKQLPIAKPLLMTVLENVLLLVVLSVMVLRSTYIENPHIEQIQTQFFLSSEVISLLISTLLLGCFGLWLLAGLLTNHFRWRKTSLGCAVGLFFLAGVLAYLAASNMRAAITDLVLLITPMLMAMLLVQLLNTRQKTYLALLLVMAAGAAMTVQCIDQFLDSNEMVIADYERNPTEQLQSLNIEPDSLEHWLYEHRIYSRDIRGFLLASNSAASFFLLALFACIGVCMEAFSQKHHPETRVAFAGYCLAVLFAVSGLLLTQSKGGIGAFVIGCCLLTVLTLFGKRLWKRQLGIGILLLIGISAAGAGIIAYGIRHGRLPGGNSMLVRWQYWQNTVQMIADHFWTGIGGGNFPYFFYLYKNPAASETIRDPHNFILSLLSQYGPLGLLGFLAAVLWPAYKSLAQRFAQPETPPSAARRTDKALWLGLLGLSVCLLLFIRPMLVDTAFWYQPADIRSAAYVVLYLFPAGIFAIAFGLLCAVAAGDRSLQKSGHYLIPALLCGLVAVLIHNLVDFALFEPGVWNIFWIVAAVLIACRHHAAQRDERPIPLTTGKRLAAVVLLLTVFVIYIGTAFLGPWRANRLLRRAMTSERPNREILEQLIAADPLSPAAAYNTATLLTQTYVQQRPMLKDPVLLQQAMYFGDIARKRNPADFKPWRLRADIAMMLAGQAQREQKTAYLQTAYAALEEAAARYPGSDRIQFTMGRLADQLGRPEQALSHYRKAVALENAYREQFKMMYPDRTPVISRLGNTAYNTAKARIEELQRDTEE